MGFWHILLGIYGGGEGLVVDGITTRLTLRGTSMQRLSVIGTSSERMPVQGASEKRLSLRGSSEP